MSQYKGSFDNLKSRFLLYNKVCYDKRNEITVFYVNYLTLKYLTFLTGTHKKLSTDVYNKDNAAYKQYQRNVKKIKKLDTELNINLLATISNLLQSEENMDAAQCIGPSRWSHEYDTNNIDTSTLYSNTTQRRNIGEDEFEFENEVVENDGMESNFKIWNLEEENNIAPTHASAGEESTLDEEINVSDHSHDESEVDIQQCANCKRKQSRFLLEKYGESSHYCIQFVDRSSTNICHKKFKAEDVYSKINTSVSVEYVLCT